MTDVNARYRTTAKRRPGDCRECGVEADACCADLGYPCCWFCTVTRVAHLPSSQEAPEWTI